MLNTVLCIISYACVTLYINGKQDTDTAKKKFYKCTF